MTEEVPFIEFQTLKEISQWIYKWRDLSNTFYYQHVKYQNAIFEDSGETLFQIS